MWRYLQNGPPDCNSDTIGKHLQVFVRDNNVEQALRVLKKKMQREGVFREMKRRRFYEKPSEQAVREKAESIRNDEKYLREVMEKGADKARKSAGATMKLVREAIGLNYF
jgi:small subunit ribosomal protein S21